MSLFWQFEFTWSCPHSLITYYYHKLFLYCMNGLGGVSIAWPLIRIKNQKKIFFLISRLHLRSRNITCKAVRFTYFLKSSRWGTDRADLWTDVESRFNLSSTVVLKVQYQKFLVSSFSLLLWIVFKFLQYFSTTCTASTSGSLPLPDLKAPRYAQCPPSP